MSEALPQKGNFFKTLWHITMHKIKGDSHEDRLESFYKGQAEGYDSYRKKLLHGRQEMFQSLPVNEGDVWVDLGAGTGENAEHLSDKLSQFSKVYQVDLCQPLLDVGHKRVEAHGWTNVEPVHADATKFQPAEGQVDLVTFSYSLTMIPDWFAAIDHAYSLLKPGGHIGVVDFYVSRKYPEETLKRHSWFTRFFWPTFFGSDNVNPNPDHLPYLRKKFDVIKLEEAYGKVPLMPLVRAPYYFLIGQKPAASTASDAVPATE